VSYETPADGKGWNGTKDVPTYDNFFFVTTVNKYFADGTRPSIHVSRAIINQLCCLI
jgi:hypothetical protein